MFQKKPTKFESDEEGVRNSRCSFKVKYLGSQEVDESRGMEVCEAAIKHLKKNKKDPVSALLHVSGDGLRNRLTMINNRNLLLNVDSIYV